MVTAKVQYSLATAKGYFAHHLSAGDYYEEGQKTSGEWFGLGAQSLDLTGRIQADDFVALCENQNPITGQTLTQRNNSQRKDGDRDVANRRVFYGFTFSPPQSVSIAALVGDDARTGHPNSSISPGDSTFFNRHPNQKVKHEPQSSRMLVR